MPPPTYILLMLMEDAIREKPQVVHQRKFRKKSKSATNIFNRMKNVVSKFIEGAT